MIKEEKKRIQNQIRSLWRKGDEERQEGRNEIGIREQEMS